MSSVARRFEERLDAVRQAAATPNDPAAKKELRRVLAGKQGLLISVAATAVESGADDLVEPATQAFARLLEDPVSRDPQCHGKLAIARALYERNHDDFDLYESGVTHVQREPIMGGSVDTAAELRGVCLMALVVQQHPRAWVYVGAMLADPERSARLAAMRAIDAGGRADIAEPLLRMAVEVERDPEVAMDALAGLLHLDPHGNLPLAAARLRGEDAERAGAAALALGSARPEGAFALLTEALEQAFDEQRRHTCATGLAMLRNDNAWQHLVELIMDGDARMARVALDALAAFRDHPGLHERVEAAVLDRGDDRLQTAFSRAFEA